MGFMRSGKRENDVAPISLFHALPCKGGVDSVMGLCQSHCSVGCFALLVVCVVGVEVVAFRLDAVTKSKAKSMLIVFFI